MPPVKFDRIVSCSSEDPDHPAKNLLLGRDYNRKWKCRQPGEGVASVIIQLNEPYTITGIDIGNESSAFVEVLVSRSSSPDDFKVLLLTSSFMTPMDARAEANRNRVRMFSRDTLCEAERKEKWDRIKVVCSQQFNKHMQFGLSFIVLHSNDHKDQAVAKPMSPGISLGRFALKDEEEPDFSAGSFFSRRKDLQASPQPAPLTGAAAVRDASSPANLAEQKVNKKRKGSDELTDSQKKKRGRPKSDDLDTPTNKDAKAKQNSRSPPEEKTKKKIMDLDNSKESSPGTKVHNRKTPSRNDQPNQRASTDTASSSKAPQNSTQHTRKPSSDDRSHITYKPFSKLFEGVEIVISGYQNPGRGIIRDRALEMGSKYSGDWRPSSTHLICAFPNTPKLQQLQAQGANAIVVSRDWVDDCYRERKKLSWRRYAILDKDRKNPSDTPEPEIWEFRPDLVVNNDSPLPPVSRRNNVAAQDTRLESDSEDSEDEIRRIKAKQIMQKKKLEEKKEKHLNESSSKNIKKEVESESSDSEDDIKRVKVNQDIKKKQLNDRSHKNTADKVKLEDDAYNCSTDADSEEDARNRLTEWSKAQKNAGALDDLPPLPEIFKGKNIALFHTLSENEIKSLSRYITAFGGNALHGGMIDFSECAENPPQVHFVISDARINHYEGTRIIVVTPDWIWECVDRQRLVSPILFELN